MTQGRERDVSPEARASASPVRTHEERPVRRLKKRSVISGIATAAVIFIVLLLRQPYLFNTPMVAWGDDAVFGIEIDDAKHLRLLDGANSRIGTSHPGPALFYISGAFDAVLYDALGFVPEHLNAQRIGYAALSSVLLGAIAALIARRTRVVETVVAVSVLTAMMTVVPDVFASSWLPHIYCLPFMLSIVAAGAILSGDRRAVLPYTISSWLLVHGHVGFIENVGGMTTFVLAVLLWRHRHEMPAFLRRNLKPLVPSALASLVFVFPMVVNLFVNWPSPWLEYYEYARTGQHDPRSLGDVWAFVASYLTWNARISGWIAAAVALCSLAGVMTLPRGDLRRFLSGILAAVGVGLALFTTYAVVGVDHFGEKYMYIGYYAFALPALVVAAGAVACCRRFTRLAPMAAAMAVVLFLIVAASADAFTTGQRGRPEVAAIASLLKGDVRRQGRTVVFTFDPPTWTFAVAVMQHGSHTGLPVCVADPVWTWFVTKRFICRSDQLAAGWRLYMSPVDGVTPPGVTVLRSQSVMVTASSH